MSTYNHILSDIVDIIRIQIRIRSVFITICSRPYTVQYGITMHTDRHSSVLTPLNGSPGRASHRPGRRRLHCLCLCIQPHQSIHTPSLVKWNLWNSWFVGHIDGTCDYYSINHVAFGRSVHIPHITDSQDTQRMRCNANYATQQRIRLRFSNQSIFPPAWTPKSSSAALRYDYDYDPCCRHQSHVRMQPICVSDVY